MFAKLIKWEIPHLNKMTPVAPPLEADWQSFKSSEAGSLVTSSSDLYVWRPVQILAPLDCFMNFSVVDLIQEVPEL